MFASFRLAVTAANAVARHAGLPCSVVLVDGFYEIFGGHADDALYTTP